MITTALFAYVFKTIVFLTAGLYIQIIYFMLSLSVMLFMYFRSRLYWKRYDAGQQADLQTYIN